MRRRKDLTADEAQLLFNWLIPQTLRGQKLVAPESVAKIIGRSVRHVIDLTDEARLEAFSHPDRSTRRKVITMRSVLLWLVESAEFEPADFIKRVKAILDLMTAAQLEEIAMYATHRRSRL